MTQQAQGLPALGFIGLGAMGGPMARNLVRAGYSVAGFDIDSERLAAAAAAGIAAAESAAQVVASADVVLTSLRSSQVFVEVAEADLIPHAREAQVFVDLGTVAAPDTRRIAAALRDRGAWLVDAPVSGGPAGSASGMLRIFVGGDEEAVAQVRPILEVLGDPERVVYCGPSGAGQVVKGVNQLAMGLGDAAYLEAIAFGVRAGVDPAAIRQAVGGDVGWRGHFGLLARRVEAGEAETTWLKFPELPYFLQEAEEQGVFLPLTRALFDFCDAAPRTYSDNMGRPTVSFWHELMTRREARGGQAPRPPHRR